MLYIVNAHAGRGFMYSQYMYNNYCIVLIDTKYFYPVVYSSEPNFNVIVIHECTVCMSLIKSHKMD